MDLGPLNHRGFEARELFIFKQAGRFAKDSFRTGSVVGESELDTFFNNVAKAFHSPSVHAYENGNVDSDITDAEQATARHLVDQYEKLTRRDAYANIDPNDFINSVRAAVQTSLGFDQSTTQTNSQSR